MGVDIGVWRARIGSFNASVRRSSSKRAKQPVCGAGKAELEVVVLAVLLLIMAGGVEYSQHQNTTVVGSLDTTLMMSKTVPLSPSGHPVTEKQQLSVCDVYSTQLVYCVDQPNRELYSNELVLRERVQTKAITIPHCVVGTEQQCVVTVQYTTLQPVGATISEALGSVDMLKDVVVVLVLLLILAGDVELNPGPGKLKVQKKQKAPSPLEAPLQVDSAVHEQEKTRVCDVFRVHYSRLLKGVTQPTLLAADLFSAGLISESVNIEISTVTGASDIDRASIIMRELGARFGVDPHSKELMDQLCMVIEEHVTLQPVALSIRKALDIPVPPVPKLPRLSPIQGFIDYLKSCYRNSQFPTYFKQPSLRIKPKKFIHLNIVSNEDTGEENCASSLLPFFVHGNITEMKIKRKPMEMVDIGKTQKGSLPRRILVEGSPGIGKTMFSWELCRQWEQGEMLQDWELIILLQLRNKRVREATTLLDMFSSDTGIKQEAFDHINSTQGKGVMIILEGYDELSEDCKTEGTIFYRLLFGEYLSECTVMVTSRQVTNNRLYTEFKSETDQHIEIVGFTKGDVDSYIESVCHDNPHILADIKLYLSSNPFIYSAAYVPLQCAILTALYIEKWRQGGKSFAPSTLTELYTALIETILLRHIDDHPEHTGLDLSITTILESQLSTHPLWKLSKLAAEGLKKRQYIFENIEFDTMGFMQSAEDTLVYRRDTSVCYCFLHLTLQEYLAALYWSRMGCEEVIESNLFPLNMLVKEGMHDKSEYHWPALFFLAGLTKLRSVPIENLKAALKSSNTWVKSDSLSRHVCGSVACSSRKCHTSFLQMLFEAQSHELTAKVFTENVKISVLVESPFTAFVTAWCLVNSDPKSSWFIGIRHHVSLFVEYFDQLFEICHPQSLGRIAGLRFRSDAEGLDSLPKLHPHTEQLETLVLTGSQCLQDKVDTFATNLTRVFYPHLNTTITDDPQWLLPVLTRLHDFPSLTSVVLLGDSVDPIRFSLTPQHCPSLKTILIRLNTSVSVLDSLVLPNLNTLEMLILVCPLTSHGIILVCSGLKQTTSLQTLMLEDTKLTLSGASMLTDAIQHNKSLQNVVVIDDTIGDEGVRVLHDALHNHSTVTMWDVNKLK